MRCSILLPAVTPAARFHVSLMIFWFLIFLSLIASLLVGYAMASAKLRNWLHMILFALLISLTLYVIFDFEYPRHGIIQMGNADHLYIELREPCSDDWPAYRLSPVFHSAAEGEFHKKLMSPDMCDLLSRSGSYRWRAKNWRYDLDMGSLRRSDKFRIIAAIRGFWCNATSGRSAPSLQYSNIICGSVFGGQVTATMA